MRIKTVLFAAAWFLAASNTPAAETPTLDDIFPTDRVLDVQITVPEDDWDTIRFQSRSFLSALAASRKHEPLKGPYTYVEASVTIDGLKFPRVGIRKKGFIGSQSTTRPSLKIKLDHVEAEGQIEGLNNLTLNNNKQDGSLVSQFMGYAVFNAAGSPAPRCAFANVTVNGKNLGIYSHVESMRRPLVKRGFGNDDGTFYEGTVADFHDGWEGSFERKFGDDETGRGHIKKLVDALGGKGETVIVDSRSEGRAWVPTGHMFDDTWMTVGFDDSNWVKGRGGVGYETSSGYESLLGPKFNFREELTRENRSVYLRFPFTVNDPKKISGLILRMKYDDGFVAYLNGHRVGSANAPKELEWRSRATDNNADPSALTFQPFYISQHVDKLRKGVNVLAIHGLNINASSSDMLIVTELRSSDRPANQVIAELVELDSFYRFWAIESLLGFWDGYSGNRNNFLFYLNPETSKFHFLPWGADSLFEKYSHVDRDRRVPLSVKTVGLIAHRLYQTPSGRARYLKTITEILDTHWNEKTLLAETKRIEALLKPYAKNSPAQVKFSRRLRKIRNFIVTRREEITRETADGMPIWTKPPSLPPLIPAEAGGFARRREDKEREADRSKDLWSAARNGDVEAIEKHLESVNVNAKDRLGATALSWAAGLGRIDAVKFLIKKGADVNARNGNGDTPLDDTAKEIDEGAVEFLVGLFEVRIDREEVNAAKPEIAKILRKNGGKYGAQLVSKPPDIWSAARQGNVEAIGEYLNSGVDVNAKDPLGATALSWAAGLGRIDAVKFLVKKGADVNARNGKGDTPLDDTKTELNEAAASFLFQIFKVRVDPKQVNAAKQKIAKILLKNGGRGK